MIEQVSFDVWNTLVTPNAEYAKLRTEALAKLAEVSNFDAKEAYTYTKKEVDRNAELHGIGLNTFDVYKQLMVNIGIPTSLVGEFAYEFRKTVEDLFKQYPPHVTDSAKKTIAELTEQGVHVNIASNSNFISGNIMHPYLMSVFGRSMFGVYSDIVETSKPSHRFFSFVLQNSVGRLAQNILHVGDNMVCDVYGAKMMGMKSAVVNSPETLYDVVFTAIKEHTNV